MNRQMPKMGTGLEHQHDVKRRKTSKVSCFSAHTGVHGHDVTFSAILRLYSAVVPFSVENVQDYLPTLILTRE